MFGAISLSDSSLKVARTAMAAGTLAGLAVLGACADNSAKSITAPASSPRSSTTSSGGLANAQHVTLCVNGPAGNYQFTNNPTSNYNSATFTGFSGFTQGDFGTTTINSPVGTPYLVAAGGDPVTHAGCITIIQRTVPKPTPGNPGYSDPMSNVTIWATSPYNGATYSSTDCLDDTDVIPSQPAPCGALNNPTTGFTNYAHGTVITFNFVAAANPGCVATIGWFKNQGNSLVPTSSFFGTAASWRTVLDTKAKGNDYYNLAFQYIAAKLGIGVGTPPANVGTAITNAELFFSGGDGPGGTIRPLGNTAGWAGPSLTSITNTLDSFNNGAGTAWAHCTN